MNPSDTSAQDLRRTAANRLGVRRRRTHNIRKWAATAAVVIFAGTGAAISAETLTSSGSTTSATATGSSTSTPASTGSASTSSSATQSSSPSSVSSGQS